MLLNSTDVCNRIWDRVDDELGFSPSCSYTGHDLNTFPPFRISGIYAVYGIENLDEEQAERMDGLVLGAFLAATGEGERMYALDWQHSAFLFDPGKLEEMESVYVEDSRYIGGGYWASFPDLYPDGDYHFFIAESLEFGYLGHPWRREVWIFGEKLVREFEQIYADLGWDLLHASVGALHEAPANEMHA